MAFNVSYSAGGTLEEVKKISKILGGVIDQIKVVNNVENIDVVGVVNSLREVQEVLNVKIVEAVQTVDLVNKISLLEQVNTVKLVEAISLLERIGQLDNVSNVERLQLLDRITQLDNVSNIERLQLLDKVTQLDNVGNVERLNLLDKVTQLDNVSNIEKVKSLDNVSVVEEIKTVDHVASIHGFPQFTRPYNTMIKMDIPSIKGVYEETFITPDVPVEMLALTVSCSGYGELDKYDLYCNGEQWFKDWYCSEVKEGLFLGTSTIVYYLPPNSELKIKFHNDSGTSKICWFGLRMLVEDSTIPVSDLKITKQGG